MEVPPILGIVGGIGPESTVEYYRALVAAHRQRTGDDSSPSIIINSIDLARTLAMIGSGQTQQLTEYLAREVRRLAAAGAEVGLLAANSVHIVFDDLQERSPIPLVSIVAAAREAAQNLGLTRLALLGTRYTMQGKFYVDAFHGSGVTVVAPLPDEQQIIHAIYVGELLRGTVQEASRKRILAIVDDMIARHEVDGVVLAGTELPILFRNGAHQRLPFLDTGQIHVQAALRLVSGRG